MKSKGFPDLILHLGEQWAWKWTEFLLSLQLLTLPAPYSYRGCLEEVTFQSYHLHLLIHESLPVSANRAKYVLSAERSSRHLAVRASVSCGVADGSCCLYTHAASLAYGGLNHPGLTVLLLCLGSSPQSEKGRLWGGRTRNRETLVWIPARHPHLSALTLLSPSLGSTSSHWIPHLLVLHVLGAWPLSVASE